MLGWVKFSFLSEGLYLGLFTYKSLITNSSFASDSDYKCSCEHLIMNNEPKGSLFEKQHTPI